MKAEEGFVLIGFTTLLTEKLKVVPSLRVLDLVKVTCSIEELSFMQAIYWIISTELNVQVKLEAAGRVTSAGKFI